MKLSVSHSNCRGLHLAAESDFSKNLFIGCIYDFVLIFGYVLSVMNGMKKAFQLVLFIKKLYWNKWIQHNLCKNHFLVGSSTCKVCVENTCF